MTKKREQDFLKTVKSWKLWFYSFAYHFLIIFLNLLIPKRTLNTVKDVIYSTQGAPSAAPGTSLFLNLLLFDLIFIILFVMGKRSKQKHYNYFGVAVVVILTNIIFQLYARLLMVNTFY